MPAAGESWPGADVAEAPQLFTIGHSRHEFAQFVDLLQRHSITAVADVRSEPFSRFQQFNRDHLADQLPNVGISYVDLGAELGARRQEPECYLNDIVMFERVALLPAFRSGLERVLRGARSHRVAMMCAEKEPLDCHRTILICRHLRDAANIQHILDNGQLEHHRATEERLLALIDRQQDLFEPPRTDIDQLHLAYQARAAQIAYRRRREIK